jgi:hypothetical protein
MKEKYDLSTIERNLKYLLQYWTDPFLQWSPEEYANITEIFLSSGSVWTPEISQYYRCDR